MKTLETGHFKSYIDKETKQTDLHTISFLVYNKPGVLVRIALVFSRRGFNIETVRVVHTIDSKYTRITITAKGEAETVEQIVKQATRLIDVFSVHEYKKTVIPESSRAIVNITVAQESKPVILHIVDEFKGQIVDFSNDNLVVQIVALPEEIDVFIDMLDKYGGVEMIKRDTVTPIS